MSVAGGALAAALVLLPLVFLIVEAVHSGLAEVRRLLLRHTVAVLLWNTVRLALACTLLCAVLGVGGGLVRGAHDAAAAGGCGRSLLVLPLGVPDFVSASAGSRSTPACTATWRP